MFISFSEILVTHEVGWKTRSAECGVRSVENEECVENVENVENVGDYQRKTRTVGKMSILFVSNCHASMNRVEQRRAV